MNKAQQQLEIEHKHLKIVSQYTIEILAANSEQEIVGYLTDTLLNQLDISDFEFYAFNSLTQKLALVGAYLNRQAVSLPTAEPTSLSEWGGIIGHAAKTLNTVCIQDFSEEQEFKPQDPSHQSALVVPVFADTKLIGVVYCASREKFAFEPQLKNSLKVMSSITAIKMEKSRAIEQLQHTIEKLEFSGKIQDTLFEIAELIFETANMQEFYERLHKCIAKLMFASNFFVGLVIEDGEAITLPYAVDEVDEVPPHEVIPLDNEKPSITGYVLKTNKPLLATKQTMQSMIDSNQVYIKGSLPNAWLGVPFGEPPLHGVVVVQSYNDKIGFTEKDEQLLCFVARHIRNAIERIQARSDLQFLALHDPLTKLSNRSLFNDRVKHALNKCRREKDKKMALLFLDLDKFKQVNDTYGHHIGDLLLIEVSKVLKKSIRESDTLSRFGGDEFAILLEDIESAEDAKNVARKIIKSLQTPFELEDIQIFTSTSIGIAFQDKSEDSIEAVISYADEAMYLAKQQGRNRAVLHQERKQTPVFTSNFLEQDLLKGLNTDQFYFMFQPIIELKSQDIVGVEALVRWNDPEKGILQPKAFLPEMEESGSIVQLDVYNINKAFELLQSWQHLLPRYFRLSINISAAGFSSIPLLEALQGHFDNTPELFQYLALETTEKAVMKGVELTRSQMRIFSKMGIHLALDDFGTGYASLSYLGQFKFNHIKIDRSFINALNVTAKQHMILESINSLAKSLSINTIAVGIENKEQLSSMRDLQCSMGQGFYISKLLTEQQWVDVLQRHKKLMVN
ncbi:EAL domain-containing protein [Paraglaciecola aestuariivivens]